MLWFLRKYDLGQNAVVLGITAIWRKRREWVSGEREREANGIKGEIESIYLSSGKANYCAMIA